MIVVYFESEAEFCEEMIRDANKIDWNVVRLTFLQKTTGLGMFRHLYLIGTYSIEGQIVKLDRYFGELTGTDQERDASVFQAATLAHTLVSEVCSEHKLEVRPGMLKVEAVSE